MKEKLGPRVDLPKTLEVLRRSGVTWDIDGVESETGHLSIREYNHLHGFKIKRPKTFDQAERYWILVDWIRQDSSVVDPVLAAIDIWNSQKVMENANMVEGAKTVSTYLARNEIFPPRVTSRPGARTRGWTYTWYERKYGPSFDLGLIRMSDTEKSDPGFKASEIAKLGTGYHFEDSYEDAERIAANGVTVVLVPQPWNLDYEPTLSNIIKVIELNYQYHFKMVRAFLTLAERITYR
ncbi:MAG: hypothetical protein ACOYT7_01995 [Patescibacteria group bacterium]